MVTAPTNPPFFLFFTLPFSLWCWANDISLNLCLVIDAACRAVLPVLLCKDPRSHSVVFFVLPPSISCSLFLLFSPSLFCKETGSNVGLFFPFFLFNFIYLLFLSALVNHHKWAITWLVFFSFFIFLKIFFKVTLLHWACPLHCPHSETNSCVQR